MRVNAFCTARVFDAISHCDRAVYCGDDDITDGKAEVFRAVGGCADGGIYIPSILDEDAFADACDRILSTGARAYAVAALSLNETGLTEAKYKLSPVMLLHKLGVLEYCTVVGGVCLDNDDLDLMAQENVPLVLLPTFAAGYGYGYAPVCAAIARGIRIGVGTGNGKYNKTCALEHEIEFLRLTANAEMRCEDAVSEESAHKILAFEK